MKRAGGNRTSWSFLWLRSRSTAQPLEGADSSRLLLPSNNWGEQREVTWRQDVVVIKTEFHWGDFHQMTTQRMVTLTIFRHSSSRLLRCTRSPETRWWKVPQVPYLVCSWSAGAYTRTHTHRKMINTSVSTPEKKEEAESENGNLTLPWWSVLISTSLRVACGFLLPVVGETWLQKCFSDYFADVERHTNLCAGICMRLPFVLLAPVKERE